ncbi:MAG: HIT family protein [Planctomycetota bacterium]|jgi:diadenosine tetraphosphate (Ap4A) HIT family hydrolase
MSTMIHDRVALANRGENPYAICRLPSGWAVIGDVQPLPGYCLLLPDPVVASINDLAEPERLAFSRDMIRIGDALLACTDAYRINYEILGNTDAALHAHIVPRYAWEPDDKRAHPAFCGYDWRAARPFDPHRDAALVSALREHLV